MLSGLQTTVAGRKLNGSPAVQVYVMKMNTPVGARERGRAGRDGS